MHTNPERFVGEEIVVTEKLDGGNTLLHAGAVYARSVAAPSTGKWMAMVKKHHAWKVTEPGVYLYGEDIYGVHSIEYRPVTEHATFYAFALRGGDGAFASFAELEAYVRQRDIPLVPVLFKGRFRSVAELRAFLEQTHAEPSALGGEREGVVVRLVRRFPAAEFQANVCKSVRPGHVQATSTGPATGGLARSAPTTPWCQPTTRAACGPLLSQQRVAADDQHQVGESEAIASEPTEG